MEYKGRTLTQEQETSVEAACSNYEDVKIEALAGTGKTFTLEAIAANMMHRRCIYIAFNKSIAVASGKSFPDNTACLTAHQVAFRGGGYAYAKRLGPLSGGMLAKKYLGLKNGVFRTTPAATGYILLDTVTRFTRSADKTIEAHHIPKRDVGLICTDIGCEKEEVEKIILPMANRVWEMMIDVDGEIPVSHDVYMKVWALGDPIIEAETIMFDEAQDANPTILDVLLKQYCQKIFVGDRYQQIYAWRGGINSMSKIQMPRTCTLSHSFRFGQKIADVANMVLQRQLKADVRLFGHDIIESRVGICSNPTAIIYRTNKAMITNVLNYMKRGMDVYINGGCKQMISLLKGARDLMNGKKAYNRELAVFKNWYDVVDFSKTDAGTDLATLVNLCESYDIDELIETLESVDKIKEENADIIFSTAHKSKGKQWESVRLFNDFRNPKAKNYTSEEANLLYVSVTRAIKTLDISNCDEAVRAYM